MVLNKTYFYIFLIICLVLAAWVLWPFMNLIFFSFIIVNMFHPVFQYFEKRGLNEHWATLLTLLVIFVTVLIPIVLLVNMTVMQARIFYHDVSLFLAGKDIPQALSTMLDRINDFLAQIPFVEYRLTWDRIRVLVSENIQPVGTYVLNNTLNVGTTIVTAAPLTIIFAFILWSAFADYKKFVTYLKKISPLPDDLDQLYFSRIRSMTNAMVRGTFMIALVQGTFAGFVLWIAGVPYLFFWTILMIFLSIVPLGAGWVTFPMAFVLILTGNVWQGIFLIFMQAIVITNVDNFLRPYLVSKEADMHPILLLLSIIGGLQAFGFFGFIYGPLIVIILLTTLEVYVKYYKERNLEPHVHLAPGEGLNTAEHLKQDTAKPITRKVIKKP